jgi:ergothioneine biosynthesis protein EgtB
MSEARHLSGDALAAALRASRARTWAMVDDLSPAQWRPERQRGVNPIAWELAHLAWFAEFWILRGPHERHVEGHAMAHRPARFAGPDEHFDSARLAHPARWTTPMPDRRALKAMLSAQLEACIDAIPTHADDDAAHEFHRLALFHEDMHGEAFCGLRAALGYPAPPHIDMPRVALSKPQSVQGGSVRLGGRDKIDGTPRGFAFDNELPGRELVLPDFEIDSAPVSAGAFLRFVEAGGYDDPSYWPGPAGAWRSQSASSHPQRWRQVDGPRQMRWFDRWLPLDLAAPVMHVNAFEAEAYCRWAGRRLPSAAEWEHAAPHIHWGASVWEWTADAFAPYPGFVAGPYREYSEPWFGNHRELRGGAFATHARMHDARYRNFFTPERTDIFAGFRTASR